MVTAGMLLRSHCTTVHPEDRAGHFGAPGGDRGLSDTKADILNDRLNTVWGREWWRRG